MNIRWIKPWYKYSCPCGDNRCIYNKLNRIEHRKAAERWLPAWARRRSERLASSLKV